MSYTRKGEWSKSLLPFTAESWIEKRTPLHLMGLDCLAHAGVRWLCATSREDPQAEVWAYISFIETAKPTKFNRPEFIWLFMSSTNPCGKRQAPSKWHSARTAGYSESYCVWPQPNIQNTHGGDG
jgi:hypothetical protein